MEKIPAGEAEQIDATAAMMPVLQDNRAKNDPDQEGEVLRGVHPKSHGCVRAEFAVNDDVDEEHRVGLFARPGQKFDAWIRYSNAAALREDDLKVGATGKRENGSRGMAVKVLDVEGPFLDRDHGRQNQDFLMINTPEFAFPDVRNYLKLNQILLLSKNGDNPAPFFLPLQLKKEGKPLPQKGDPTWGDFWVDFTEADFVNTGKSFEVIKTKIERQTVRNPLQVQYFGAAPFLFGEDRAMKVSADPCRKVEQSEFVDVTADNPSQNYLREALTETMRDDEDVCFDFKIQVRGKADLEEQQIENASTLWPDELASY
jgi:hypothetical protein